MSYSFSSLFSPSMLVAIVALVLVLWLATSCSPRTPEAVIKQRFSDLRASHHCIKTPQGERCYYLVLPASAPRALIVALHPAFHSVAATEKVAGFAPKAVAAGYAVLFPEGIDKQWNDGRHAERSETFRRRIDDVGFLTSIITKVQAQLSLSPSHTLLAGMSNGGMMSMRMACESDVFAAAVTVVANLPRGMGEACTARPKHMVMVFGVADGVVPFAGGALGSEPTSWGEVESAEDTIAFFAKRAGATRPPSITRMDAKDDKTTAEHRVFTDAAPAVEAYVVEGMGHTWPNEPSQLRAWLTTRGRVTRELDASDIILAQAAKLQPSHP